MVTKKTTIKKAPVKTAPKKVAAKKAPVKKTVVEKAPKKNVVLSGTSLKVSVYDASGKEVRSIELPSYIFDLPKNDTLVYQVVTAMEANARTPIAHTKTRGEVRGGGKKPWQQKGTGRARHGSIRSPIWRGGGVTFGPRNEKDYSQKINKKMRAKALAIVLSEKFKKGRILFIDTPAFTEPKTKEAKSTLIALSSVKGFEELATRRNNAALIALGEKNVNVKKSFANIGSVSVGESRDLNPTDVLNHRYLVITNPEAALEALTARMAPKSKSEVVSEKK